MSGRHGGNEDMARADRSLYIRPRAAPAREPRDTRASTDLTPSQEDAMAINAKRVVVGGIAAGVVIFVLDFVTNALLLGDVWKREMDALNPALSANAESPAAMASFVVIDLLFGVLLVWLYAAIRPRFGPGPRTAVLAGLVFWVYSALLWTGFTTLGLFSWTMYAVGAVAGLVMFVAAALVGGAIYKETPTDTGRGAGLEGGSLGAPARGARV